MFAQANSEHCRHKIFNADFTVDGVAQPQSLFSMIRHTQRRHPQHTVVAYADNASIMEGTQVERFVAGSALGAAISKQSALTPRADEGRDAQPSDRDLALPGRLDRRRRRDPRRGRDRPRLQAQGRPDRLHGVEALA